MKTTALALCLMVAPSLAWATNGAVCTITPPSTEPAGSTPKNTPESCIDVCDYSGAPAINGGLTCGPIWIPNQNAASTSFMVIADATSGHAADNLAFSLNTLLAVFDAIHAHAADSLTLDTSNATFLTVQEASHSHSADNIDLSLNTWLAIVEAAHGHTADSPTLSADTSLQIAEALHAHYADVVVLGFPSAPGACPTVEEIVQAVLLQLNAESIAAAVWAHATRVITGPTPNDNADALLARAWP